MRKKIALKNGRSCIAAYSFARPKATRWMVFLPESAADFMEGQRQELVLQLGSRLAKNLNYLVVNKPGVSPAGTNAPLFEQSFRRQRRIQDALTVLKNIVPENDEIFLVGYSEGAYLAPQVALQDPRVKALVMIGGGTRGWLKEELSNAGPLERPALIRQIREIHQHPRSLKKWNSFSYATWHSYREDSTLNALKKLKIPMLAILGARDRTINFKSALTDLKEMARRKPVQVRVFDNCGHSFVSHWADAWHEIKRFLNLWLD
ncbi:MAG: alpha/beta fold hydrolase [Bdellovibrionales bacterium]